MREMTQLHDMDMFIPRDLKSLTTEERTRVLSLLIFLKEKGNGDIKSRTCINGVPQRAYIKKVDAATPTVMTDSVFITGAVEAYGEQEVATCDFPEAFLHTIMVKKVILVLRGEQCKLMVKVNPRLNRKYISSDKRCKQVLYMELYKLMYGLMRSALLFYRKLKGIVRI